MLTFGKTEVEVVCSPYFNVNSGRNSRGNGCCYSTSLTSLCVFSWHAVGLMLPITPWYWSFSFFLLFLTACCTAFGKSVTNDLIPQTACLMAGFLNPTDTCFFLTARIHSFWGWWGTSLSSAVGRFKVWYIVEALHQTGSGGYNCTAGILH